MQQALNDPVLPLFLTFDLGTTLYKFALFDSRGVMLGVERIAPPAADGCELPTKFFLETIVTGAMRLHSRLSEHWKNIVAVSFATQANSFTLLDRDNKPLVPLILWPDQRANEIADELKEISGIAGFRDTTGMPRFGPLLGLAKLHWLVGKQKLSPRVARFCYLSDYLTVLMTGHFCTEAGVAGLSGAADVQHLQWWLPVFKKLNIPVEWMPPIVRAGTNLGPILPTMADLLKLPRTCRFIVGCLDQYAAAIGTGTVEPGQICETTGTVLAAVSLSDHYQSALAENVFQGPAFRDGQFFQMRFSSTSANLLEWYRNTLPDKPSFQSLTQAAIQAPPTDLEIEPYHDTGPISSSFRHVQPHHTPGQVTRAIMQRVARSLAEQVRALCGTTPPKEIRAAGGAAKNDYWLQLKARELQIPITAVATEEPTSLGAAILAASAMGFGEVNALAAEWGKIRATFTP